jgi:hypothetical protein
MPADHPSTPETANLGTVCARVSFRARGHVDMWESSIVSMLGACCGEDGQVLAGYYSDLKANHLQHRLTMHAKNYRGYRSQVVLATCLFRCA